MFRKVVTDLFLGMTLIVSTSLYAVSANQNIDDFQKTGAKVIKNLEMSCDKPKTVYQYWDVIEALSQPPQERQYRTLSDASAIYRDIHTFKSLDFKSKCDLAIIDNQIIMLTYELASILKGENINNSVASIDGRLIALLLIKELYDERPIINSITLEIADNYLTDYKDNNDPEEVIMLASGIWEYSNFLKKYLSYSFENIKKIDVIFDNLNPFYQYLNKSYAEKNASAKISFVFEDMQSVISAQAERGNYEDKWTNIILALKRNNVKFLRDRIKNYVELYNKYDELALEYNQRNKVEYGFDGVVRKDELSVFIALAYARLKKVEEAKLWTERAELVRNDGIYCEGKQIVEDTILDDLLKTDPVWYRTQFEDFSKFCVKKEKIYRITKKFKSYDALLQRVERSCNNPSQYGYINILKNKNSSAVDDMDFHFMVTSDEMLKNESIESGVLTIQCKEAVLTNNKEILKFYVENMPADAWYYNEAKESLAKLE